MRVAVSGATGFIGRHVLSELSRHQVEVTALVRGTSKIPVQGISPSPSPLSSPARGEDTMGIAYQAEKGRVIETVRIDLQNPPDRAFDLLGRPDVLIHLAWGGLPNYRSLHHFEQELPMQYRFLSGLIRDGLPALVVSGTCFEYGMQSGRLTEETETRPDNPYGFAKDTLRRQLEFLKSDHPFALVWARLFYVYGAGQAESSLWPQLNNAVKRGDKTFNMSGGEQLRDYLPVAAAAKDLVMPALHKADIGVVNICSGKPVSVRTLVEGWVRENGWKIELNLGHYPYPDYEPMEFWGDRSRLDGFLKNKVKDR